MKKESVAFAYRKVEFIYDAAFSTITSVFPAEKIVVITDENVSRFHQEKFEGLACITVPAGEAHKQQATADSIIQKLISIEADKDTVLVGAGGGVITDLTGYVASIYKRGIKLALAPTTVLAMVDAAVGGKNGVDCGSYKNMVGTVYQPELILFDYRFLQSLPKAEWINGFAEIIKHACIKDSNMFAALSLHDISYYISNAAAAAKLIEENVGIKKSIVVKDEFEKAERRLLNFGHTLGHAVENMYGLMHGHAVSIGMVLACRLSEKITGFKEENTGAVVKLLQRYDLPVHVQADIDKVWQLVKLDKKRSNSTMNFVLLHAIGEAAVHPLSMETLKNYLYEIEW